MSFIVQSPPVSTSDAVTSRRRRVQSRLAILVGLALAVLACAPAFAQIPGAESFVKPLKTPIDFWEVSDYLVRTGQVKQALPFLAKFEAANPDDDAYVSIRERYGYNSFLRLLDYNETRAIGERLSKAVAEAGRRVATRPERLNAAIGALKRTREERVLALEHLREAGAYAVPALVAALQDASATGAARTALILGIAELDGSAIPPLVATLHGASSEVAEQVAEILGEMGDRRALPELTIVASSPKPEAKAAQNAIARLTGLNYRAQPKPPIRVLDDAARTAFLALPTIPETPENLWTWDAAANAPVAKPSTRDDIAAAAGLRYGKAATKLDPQDISAKLNYLSLALERNATGAAAEATAAGPDVLSQLVKRALADKRFELAAITIPLLAKTTNPATLTAQDGERFSPLIQALSSGERRVEFAAAEAIVGLNPRRPFPGSSRLVPTIARFASIGSYPRAIVIDGNGNRGSQTVGYLKNLGYDALLAPTGEAGFKLAAESADVELITVDPDFVQGTWRLSDTLANLSADDHTSGIPVFIVGPLAIRHVVAPKLESFPNVRYLVTPTELTLFKRQVESGLTSMHARPLTNAERAGYPLKATMLLGQIANNAGNPFEGELAMAGPSLTLALNTPATATQAAAALGDLPRVEAQRDLADVVLNPAFSAELRLVASGQLVRSIKRFGPLLSLEQERRLVALISSETDDTVQPALKSVADALKRKATSNRSVHAQRPGVSSTR